MFTLPNEPQTIGRVLDQGFRLYATGLKRVLPLTVIIGLTGLLFGLYTTSFQTNPGAIQPGPGFGLAVIVYMLTTLWLWTAVILRYDSVAGGLPRSVGQALGRGLAKLLPVAVASVVYFVALIVGTLLLIVPGIILSLSLLFFIYAIALDNAGPMSGLSRSHKLVWGNWWRTAAAIAVPYVIVFALTLAVQLPMMLPMAAGGDPQSFLIWTRIGEALVNIFIAPMSAAFGLVIYHDLKLRKQGADLESRMAAGEPVTE